MGKLLHVAARAMDMYHQDLMTEESFFGEDHFKYMVSAAYAKLLNDEYDKARLINRQTMGFTYVELSPEWIKKIPLTLEETTEDDNKMFYADLPQNCKPFSFAFDAMSNGIQGIYSSCHECDFIKVSLNDLWQLRLVPPCDKIFYFLTDRRVIFKNITNKNVGKHLFVNLIPVIDVDDDDFMIPESKELEIINMALQIMIAAKNGVVIQKADDQNKNVVLPEELNPDLNPDKRK